jgi:hypothetical protein
MTYADYEWVSKADTSKYGGQWIAVINKQVVASGKDIKKVVETARKEHPKTKPLLTKIRNTLSVL